VAFYAWPPDLGAGDTNDRVDIFVHDRQTNTTQRVSLSSSGVEGNDTSWYPAISGDGRFVAFRSFASNLVSGDTYLCDPPVGDPYNCEDVFVRDRDTDVDGIFDEAGAVSTVRVSVSTSGTQGNNGSWDAAISSDGRFVVFGSAASNLVASDTNGKTDIFVRDRDTSTTIRVSVSTSGTQGNGDSYSADVSDDDDGRYVVFSSDAANLVSGDTNGKTDVFVRDRNTNTTTRLSVSTSGVQGDNWSYAPTISSDGALVAFDSGASNLVTGDTNNVADVFVRNRDMSGNGTFDEIDDVSTTRVSVSTSGVQGNADSADPAISSDGRFVAFGSAASNLVADDTNGVDDVFLHDILGAVGGIAELPPISGSSAPNYVPLAELAVAVLALLSAGAWFARRRTGPGRRP
jgi:Tol biopolymer transport system component